MKKHKIIFWISTGFLFLFEAVMPIATLLFAPAQVTAGAEYLQFPKYFAFVLITFKILGAIVLVIPGLPRRLKEWAYAGFAFNFICATVSHLVVDGFVFVSFVPLIILAIAVVSYISYFKTYGHDKLQVDRRVSQNVFA
mgnify:CR=1 FL=1